MSKRRATPLEVKEILADEPWNLSQNNHDSETAEIAIVLTDESGMVPLRITCHDIMMLDGRRKVLSPLDGIKVPELAARLHIPIADANAKFLIGQLKETYPGYEFDMTGITSAAEIGAIVGLSTHLMTIEKCEIPYDQREFIRTQQAWKPIYLQDIRCQQGLQDVNNTDLIALQAVSKKYNNNRYYWKFTVYPIGFHCLRYCEDDGMYYLTDQHDETHIDMCPENLIPVAARITRELYAQALSDLEYSYEQIANNLNSQLNNLRQLCQVMNERALKLQEISGFEDFEPGFKPYNDCERIQYRNSIYTVENAKSFLRRVERKAQCHQEFFSKIEGLRDRIEAAYGELDTSNPYYAEAIFPIHEFGRDDAAKEVARFHYSVIGYAKLMKWLEEQEEAIREAENYTAKA